MNKILIDTNVLIYAKDASSIYHRASLSIFDNERHLFITSKNLTEYYAVVTRGERPLMSPLNALLDFEEFATVAEVLYPSEASYKKLNELVLRHQPRGLKIHDFEIAAIALDHGITRIATFNESDFRQIPELEIIVPKQYT